MALLPLQHSNSAAHGSQLLNCQVSARNAHVNVVELDTQAQHGSRSKLLTADAARCSGFRTYRCFAGDQAEL